MEENPIYLQHLQNLKKKVLKKDQNEGDKNNNEVAQERPSKKHPSGEPPKGVPPKRLRSNFETKNPSLGGAPRPYSTIVRRGPPRPLRFTGPHGAPGSYVAPMQQRPPFMNRPPRPPGPVAPPPWHPGPRMRPPLLRPQIDQAEPRPLMGIPPPRPLPPFFPRPRFTATKEHKSSSEDTKKNDNGFSLIESEKLYLEHLKKLKHCQKKVVGDSNTEEKSESTTPSSHDPGTATPSPAPASSSLVTPGKKGAESNEKKSPTCKANNSSQVKLSGSTKPVSTSLVTPSKETIDGANKSTVKTEAVTLTDKTIECKSIPEIHAPLSKSLVTSRGEKSEVNGKKPIVKSETKNLNNGASRPIPNSSVTSSVKNTDSENMPAVKSEDKVTNDKTTLSKSTLSADTKNKTSSRIIKQEPQLVHSNMPDMDNIKSNLKEQTLKTRSNVKREDSKIFPGKPRSSGDKDEKKGENDVDRPGTSDMSDKKAKIPTDKLGTSDKSDKKGKIQTDTSDMFNKKDEIQTGRPNTGDMSDKRGKIESDRPNTSDMSVKVSSSHKTSMLSQVEEISKEKNLCSATTSSRKHTPTWTTDTPTCTTHTLTCMTPTTRMTTRLTSSSEKVPQDTYVEDSKFPRQSRNSTQVSEKIASKDESDVQFPSSNTSVQKMSPKKESPVESIAAQNQGAAKIFRRTLNELRKMSTISNSSISHHSVSKTTVTSNNMKPKNSNLEKPDPEPPGEGAEARISNMGKGVKAQGDLGPPKILGEAHDSFDLDDLTDSSDDEIRKITSRDTTKSKDRTQNMNPLIKEYHGDSVLDHPERGSTLGVMGSTPTHQNMKNRDSELKTIEVHTTTRKENMRRTQVSNNLISVQVMQTEVPETPQTPVKSPPLVAKKSGPIKKRRTRRKNTKKRSKKFQKLPDIPPSDDIEADVSESELTEPNFNDFMVLSSTFEGGEEETEQVTKKRQKASDFFEKDRKEISPKLKEPEVKRVSLRGRGKPKKKPTSSEKHEDSGRKEKQPKTKEPKSKSRDSEEKKKVCPEIETTHSMKIMPSRYESAKQSKRDSEIDRKNAIGIEFIQPISGYQCSLCNVFFFDNPTAMHHCALLSHKMKVAQDQTERELTLEKDVNKVLAETQSILRKRRFQNDW